MSYLDAQVPVDSFTALHNLAQAPRNSLLEENGIIPSNDEDMGWDIGATPNNVSEVAHVAASEQPTLQMNGLHSNVTMLTEPSMPLTNGFEPELGDAVDRPISSSRQPITEDDYQNSRVEMADVMRSNGKNYVLVSVISVVLGGLLLYVFVVDRKVSLLERELKNLEDRSLDS